MGAVEGERAALGAAEHLIGALRCMYRHAVNDELIAERDNPAARVAKPRRLASTRGALPGARLAEINQIAVTTGDDPELDALLLGVPTETACRRYDHLWERLGRHLPWVATQQVTTHWLRHTTLTWVERNFGYGVARAFAGHQGKNDAGTTTTYIRAEVEEVAAALSALTGESHPLAPLSGERARMGPNTGTADRPDQP